MVEANNQRTEGKRTKDATAKGVSEDGPQLIGGEWSFRKRPDFLKQRVELFSKLYEAQKAKYAALPRKPISITMPDGAVKDGVSFETSTLDIVKGISKQLVDKVVVAKVRYVDGRVATLDEGLSIPEELKTAENDGEEGWLDWDVTRPFEGSCELKFFQFKDKEGREAFWHSSAHVLGETLETEFGVHLTHGPPTSDGFFYDSYTGKDVSLQNFRNPRSNLIELSCIEHLRQKLQGHRRRSQEGDLRQANLRTSHSVKG
jgi:threonyl-tRNA synthetase